MEPNDNPADEKPVNSGVEPISPIKQSILLRVKLLYTFFTLLCIAIFVKIVWIQVGASGDELRDIGVQISFKTEVLEARRGNILSHDHRILSTSIPLYEIRMDFGAQGLSDELFKDNVTELATSLSNFFKDKSPSQYLAELNTARIQGKRYGLISPRKVNFVELQQIKQFPIFSEGLSAGFIAQESYRRVKPLGDVAGRTIGFVNSNGVKLGVEGGFDDVLRGVNGLTVKQKISGDFWIPISSPLNIEPVNGYDVVTTIDIELQDIVQTALAERIAEVEADWGTVVLMEVSTGQIRALANITRLKSGQLVEDYNYAIGMSQEPGSTFKLAGLLTLIDDAKVPLSTIVDTEGGEVMIGQAKVVDTRSWGYGPIPLKQVFEVSSNIGMAKAVNRSYGANPARFVDNIIKMGLGKDLSLQLAGEPRPTIKHPKVKGSGWDGTSLTMMSYGYAIRLTPLQTLSFYNAVANGGKFMRPQFVSALMENGRVIKQYEPETIIEQIASPGSIKIAQAALAGVVQNGTARALLNDQYSVAAKTGTAQIAMGRRGYTATDGSRHYLGTIAGYFPANNPRYSMIIAFKTYYKAGSGKVYYGGALAAPVFRKIADRIHTSDYDFLRPISANNQASTQQTVRRTALAAEIISRRQGVTDSLGVPLVVGLGLAEAVTMVEKAGYGISVTGIGRVKSQRLAVDSVNNRRTVHLTLAP